MVAMEDNRRILIPASDVVTILKQGTGRREDRPRRDRGPQNARDEAPTDQPPPAEPGEGT
jgi:hypothetical protein